jgi:hypothetical protein
LEKRAMNYYIEVKRGREILQEHSVVCVEKDIEQVLAWLIFLVKDIAEKITVYTHEGLHNSDTIKEVTRIVLPEA